MRLFRFFLLALVFGLPAKAANLVMPADLVADARSHGCRQIDEHYERPGEINPPYIYEAGSSKPSMQPAFYWCRKEGPLKHDIPYVLRVLNHAASRIAADCPDEIPYWNKPVGLSIELSTILKLDGYAPINNPARKYAGLQLKDATELVDAYDGVETRFVCRNGEWLYRIKE